MSDVTWNVQGCRQPVARVSQHFFILSENSPSFICRTLQRESSDSQFDVGRKDIPRNGESDKVIMMQLEYAKQIIANKATF